MLERRSLRAPIALGIVMIVLVVVLAAIWIVFTTTKTDRYSFLAFLAIGITLLAAVLAGVIAYLTLTVKAINLNRRQSNFIDSVTHELKSPIASLKLYLQTMTRREVEAEERQNFHRIMLDDVERLDSLINHLLDVARVNRMPAGNKKSEWTEIRVDQLLQHCGSAICLQYAIDPQSVIIDSPPIQLRQSLVQLEILLRNLIDNAVKYGGSPPQVRIAARCNDGQTRIMIDDNGPGIPPELRRKIFGRFVRLGNELERSRQGTGLGLYLVRNVARSIGGTVTVDDRGNDEGSRFQVRLPGGEICKDADTSLHAATNQAPLQARDYSLSNAPAVPASKKSPTRP